MAHEGSLVERLFSLWDNVPAEDDEAEAAFRQLYTDPVRINGEDMTVAALVARARNTSAALADRSTQVLHEVAAADSVAVAFRISARHVGAWSTPLGEVHGHGQPVELQVIDVLRLRDGRIHELWMVADMLGALGRSGAVTLAEPAAGAGSPSG